MQRKTWNSSWEIWRKVNTSEICLSRVNRTWWWTGGRWIRNGERNTLQPTVTFIIVCHSLKRPQRHWQHISGWRFAHEKLGKAQKQRHFGRRKRSINHCVSSMVSGVSTGFGRQEVARLLSCFPDNSSVCCYRQCYDCWSFPISEAYWFSETWLKLRVSNGCLGLQHSQSIYLKDIRPCVKYLFAGKTGCLSLVPPHFMSKIGWTSLQSALFQFELSW